MKKRILAAMIALCVWATSVPMDADVFAQGAEEQMMEEPSAQLSTESTAEKDTETGDVPVQPSGEEAAGTETENLAEESETEEGTVTVPSIESASETETETEFEPFPTENGTETADTEFPAEETETESQNTEMPPDVSETEEKDPSADGVSVSEEETETESTDEIEKETDADLNYIMQEKDFLETPDVQNIAVSIGKESSKLKDLVLNYRNLTTGEVFSAAAAAKEGDLILFTMEYKDTAQAGIYQLESISYKEAGTKCRILLSKVHMTIRFGVNMQTDSLPDQMLSSEEGSPDLDASIVTMNEKGEIISENTVEDVLNREFSDGLVSENIMRYASGGTLKVVLDPGHDATHAGAQYFGSGEEDLTLKIAKFCRDELNTYSGVSVFMVRETEACPYGGNISSSDCIIKRVDYAKNVGADVYVSFHLNADTNSSAHGIGVFYPNGNYNGQIGEEGKGLATSIFNKLAALGLEKWADGVIIRNAVNDKYPDGSVADWTGVIRRNKLNGIPAVLIEHAFLSNQSDYDRFLSSDEKLKMLGMADAAAIAEYYGLKKAVKKPTIQYTQSRSDGGLKIKWGDVSDASSYQVFRSTKKDSGYAQIATVLGESEYIDKNVKAGTKYYYRVRAVFSNGSVSEDSKEISGMVLKKPVINSVSMNGSKKLKIIWEKVSGAAGYKVYRYNDGTKKYEQIAKVTSGNTTSYIDKVASDNKSYSYKVKAYNSNNGKEGDGIYSDAKSGKTIGTPTISSIVSKNETDLKLSWKKVSGASGYQIFRSTAKDGKYEKIKTISSGNTITYEDKSVKKAKTYYFKVRAMFKNGDQTNYSAYSGIVSGKTAVKTAITKITSVTDTKLKIQWKKVSGAWGYRVKRSTSSAGTYSVVATIAGKDKVSYEDKSLKAGKTYYYKVETINKVNGKTGYSGDSKAVYGKTAAKTSISYVISIGSNKTEIGWKAVNGAWGYRVKRSDSAAGSYKTIVTVEGKGKVSYRDTTVKAGKKYYYAVEVINKVNGNKGYSGNSKAVTGMALAGSSITTVKAESSKSIALKWKTVSGAGGYEIRRSDSEKGSYKVIAKVNGGKTSSYKDTTVKAGKNYFYKVRPYAKSGTKTGYAAYSKVQKAWTVSAAVISKITSASGNKVTLEWKKVKMANGYTIQRSTNEKSGFQTIGTVTSVNTLTYSDKTAKSGIQYYYRVAATNKVTGRTTGRGNYSKTCKVPVLAGIKISSIVYTNDQALQITWKGTSYASGYQVLRSTEKNGSYESLKKLSQKTYTDNGVTAGKTYYYKVRAYAKSGSGATVYGPWSDISSQTAGYQVSGNSSLSVDRMVSYYHARYLYPADVYTDKGAETAESFFTILKEEAEAEGIKTEVLFAQVILETGGLTFRGDVSAEQCNFGGLGATGNGVKGESFPDVRTGLRAQAQHLKAYANKEPLNNACVDRRFYFVKRGSAPYVEWLSIPKNPNGGGWAMDPDYAEKLMRIIRTV